MLNEMKAVERNMMDCLSVVKKSPLGEVLKNMCEHAVIVLIRKPSNIVLSQEFGVKVSVT